MCELFAMSSRYPATVQMSLEEFSRHGGLSGPHKDGWGIAWHDERDVRLVREAGPAADSACVRFEWTTEGLQIEALGVEQEVALFASVPLTGEDWIPMSHGQVAVAKAGRIV